jgi:transcriptional regulator GlxA family with amidase domain
VLAKAGLLDGLTATTHHLAFAEFRQLAPHVTIDATKRFVDNGTVITSAGISAGIDMALHVVAKLLGHEQARETAEYMEYDWKGDQHRTESR